MSRLKTSQYNIEKQRNPTKQLTSLHTRSLSQSRKINCTAGYQYQTLRQQIQGGSLINHRSPWAALQSRVVQAATFHSIVLLLLSEKNS